jgi:hypothetical protein
VLTPDSVVAELVARRADGALLTAGNPKGLTVNRLNENGMNGLNSRGRA